MISNWIDREVCGQRASQRGLWIGGIAPSHAATLLIAYRLRPKGEKRVEITKEELLEMFKYNKYKVRTRDHDVAHTAEANLKCSSNTLSRIRLPTEHSPLYIGTDRLSISAEDPTCPTLAG